MEDTALYFEKDIFLRRKKEGRYSKEISFDYGRQEIREYYVENDIERLRKNHPGRKGLNGNGCRGIWEKQKVPLGDQKQPALGIRQRLP